MKNKKDELTEKTFSYNVTKATSSKSGLPVGLRNRIEYYSFLTIKSRKLEIRSSKRRHIFSGNKICYEKKYRVNIPDIESVGYKTTYSLCLPLISPTIALLMCIYLFSSFYILLFSNFNNNWGGFALITAGCALFIFLLMNVFAIKKLEIRLKKGAGKPSKIRIPVAGTLFVSKAYRMTLSELCEELGFPDFARKIRPKNSKADKN